MKTQTNKSNNLNYNIMKVKHLQWKRAAQVVLFVLLLNAVGLTKLHAQNGALNGVFSISENTQVQFSQGNLQYQASTNTWRFAEHQWDYVGGDFKDEGWEKGEEWRGSYGNVEGSSNNYTSPTYDGWIDLFGWGTSGYDHGALCYQPWGLSLEDSSYYAYGSSTYNLYDQTGQADWGYNAIGNGGNANGQWKTLTQAEWSYLLFERATVSGMRFARARVNGVNGLILLPDNWDSSVYSLVDGLYYYNNIIEATDWTSQLEVNGAVFLPASGYRRRYDPCVGCIIGIGIGGGSSGGGGSDEFEDWNYCNDSDGEYWTSSYSDDDHAYCMEFGDDDAYYSGPLINNDAERYKGYAVRLVQTVQATSYNISTQVNPVYGGNVTGAGTYEPNETCTLTAIPNEGYTFVNWMEIGETVSTDSIYSFQVITDRQLVANFSNNNVGIGLLNGVFSVSENVQVSFSQGNLQYQASTNTWKFAENQWECIGYANSNISQTYTGWIDLFGWGTSGYNHGANCYQPWCSGGSYSDYYAYGVWEKSLFEETGQADWGYNAISNGGNTLNQWRTLTYPEWDYIFNTRNTTSGIRYAMGCVNNMNGVILLPDNWALATYTLNSPNNGDFSSNIISSEEWNSIFEANGAVFLPVAGWRPGTSVYDVGGCGNYWSSSYYSDYCAYFLRIADYNDITTGYYSSSRRNGHSVRLVKTIQATSHNIDAVPFPIDGGTVLGTGQYDLGQNCTLVATPNEGYTFVNWTENGEVVSENASYSFTVNGNRNLVANFAIAYFFNTYVDEDVYPMNTAIPIHGTVTSIGNAPVANLEVEIGITVMDWKRTLQAITNENGQFTATFEPLPLESGYYTVNSGLVGNNSTEVHDSFDIMGMTILEKTIEDMQVVNDYWILCDVIENIPKTGLVKIINRNSFALTNIQVNVLSAPMGCEFTFAPMDLAGLSEGYLSYTAHGTIPTQGYEYQEVRLKATCDQGAEAMFTIWFYCEEAWGTLEVSPSALNTTMTRGKSKTIDITLSNNGTSATGAITVSLPNNLEWMSVVGWTTLPSIAVNESATFTLRLSPSNNFPLGQYTGTIGINCEHGDGVTLPYTITAVSDENGAFVVDVTDEFTTNTNDGNGPHVEGAEVTVTGYYSHETVAHGYTDANGTFSVSSLPEGYYTLNVQANGHSGYENNIYIDAGVTKEVNVFLQYQGVTYSWHVEPTEIQDVYTIVLNMEFEVNVPIPVVTLGAPQRIPEFEDSYTFNYVITNHGLIDALNLTLYTPENEYYLFTALYDHIDTLHAQSTLEIPCVVTRKSNLTIGCGEWALSRVQYSYLSGEELMYNQAIAYTLLSESASCNQNLPSLGGGYGGYIGGGGYGGGSGSGGSGGGSGSGGGGGTGTGGHGAPTHPGHGGHGGGGAGNGNFSTPLIINQIPNVNVQVGVQFSQQLTMTREAFIGTFAVHNGHATNAVTGIGLDFVIKDEEGNDRTNLFQISVDTLINVTGIDGNGTLAAGMDGMVKILFIPTREAAPTDSIVYSFGGTFAFVDPWNSVSHTMNLLPTYLTVHPSPDLHIDYFVARDVYGDNPLTVEEEPSIPAELAVRIWNKGAGTANNVILQTAEPIIVDNAQGLLVDFDLYGAYIDGVGVQVGLDSIIFGNIESGQTKVGEWLFTSSLLAHMVSYNAQVIHNNSFGNPKLSLVSHVGIHELTHPIYSQGTRTDGIHDFLVNDIPDENNYPDSIYFSNGGKTSVGVVESIGFDHYVTNHDTIVTLTVNPSRIGWNYGETDDPGRNLYELVSCTRNNDSKVIPLSNVWQEAIIMPNSGDSIYVNKLRIVDTVSAVQTVTYTLVYASIPNSSHSPIGAIDGLFSVGNSKKVYFSQGNLQYQASTDTWRFATNQYDHIGEDNANISQTYDGWIDLFGWGTSGYDHGAVCYQPWSTSQTNSDYYAYGDSQNSLYDQTGKADWGYNTISNGGNQENLWHTLNYWEWKYVFQDRTTTSGIRYAKAVVDEVKGIILLPDDWEAAYYTLNNTNDNQASFNSNTITASAWGTLEQHGAVFLPAAGFRDGVSVHFMNDRAWYWSSYHGNENWSWAVSFGDDFLGLWSDARCSGHAVRLVKTVTYTINTTSSPIGGGTVIGAGTYDSGETCTLTAIANEGHAFVNWTENGNTVSTNSTISFVVSCDRNIVANFLYIGTEEMMKGMFSVSNNKKVCFSQGNLQYQASTNTWRFADHQWDWVGGTVQGVHYGNVGSSSNSNISSTYDGWIDLFGWGTSGWDNGNNYYHPWDIKPDNDGTLFGPPGKHNLVGEYANADWGVYNPISNGGNQANQWRTLTYWEWDYLFNTRATSSGVRYAKAQLNGVNGLILVPDNWDASVYELQNVNTSESSFDSNVIDLTIWINTFESNGAVFLPSAGMRIYGTTLFYLNAQGAYWSSTCHGNLDDYASNWGFSDEWLNHFAGNRSYGLSVRLVRDVVTQTTNLSQGWNWFSTYLDITLNDLETALVEALPGTTINIKSQTQNVKYQNGRWAGQLTALDLTRMYMISVEDNCQISLEGLPINPSGLTATINNGANWLAFPYSESMTVTDFFGSFPANNDQVKSQSQNARYQGGRWGGQLNTLVPGKGYIYISNSPGTKTFTFPISTR